MRVRVAHVSMQYSDGPSQHTADLTKVFDRAVARKVAWVTGTESGPGANDTSDEIVRIAREHDYRPWVPSAGKHDHPGWATDAWLAVRKDLITDNWEEHFTEAIPGSAEVYRDAGIKAEFPKWGPRGLVTVGFDCAALQGRINLCAAHYLTHAHKQGADPETHGIDHWKLNEKLAQAVGDWAVKVGHGHDLAFYAGDQNMSDQKNDAPEGDTFMGEPFTSLADELKDWQSTGHGPIDVIASYNRDRRVTGVNFQAFNDREFSLNTDHFYLEGVFDIAELAAAS